MKSSTMKTFKKNTLLRILFSISAVLSAFFLVGTNLAYTYDMAVNDYLGITESTLAGGEGETMYSCSYDTLDSLLSAKKEVITEVEQEGIVLLKNNGALPLTKQSKISCFGRTSVDNIYGGTGSGSVDSTLAVTLTDALSEVFSVNEVLLDFYRSSSLSREKSGEVYVAEVPVSSYTKEIKSSYAQYSDAAVVTIGRVGGEGSDLAQGDYGDGTKYLALNQDEKDMLTEVKTNFDTIILLVNSSNAMELDWLDEYEIDACLWIGGLGLSGATGVADVLCGEVNPSGKLVDTYATDSFSSPAIINSGSFDYANANDILSKYGLSGENGKALKSYLVETEGIYIGYKYYETRYEDCVLQQGNAASQVGTYRSIDGWSYAEEVVYPFGYGLSYTTFSKTLESVEMGEDSVEVTVTVENTGTTAGKEVVQIYVQTPYTDYDREYGIEKSAIQLAGYTKSALLEPGEEQTVSVSIDKADFASYDAKGAKTYIMDAGDYYLSVGGDSHEALNNILAAKGKTVADGMTSEGEESLVYHWIEEQTDATTYAISKSGGQITNQLSEADLNTYGYEVTYLTRSDWEKSWPIAYTGISASEEMVDALALDAGYEAGSSDISSVTLEAKNGLTLYDMLGLDYDDAQWDSLLDELSISDIASTIGVSMHSIRAIESISSPAFVSYDGPAGFSVVFSETKDRSQYEKSLQGGGFTSSVVLASTWNDELAGRVGEMMGEEGLYLEVDCLYGPAANIHRTPYSGRNFEYYSEDPFLSGKIGAAQVKGLQNKGIIAMIKHFAFNDQETNREGLSTFGSEQAFREISLRAFQDIIEEGNALAVMNGLNRIGLSWTGHHVGLMTEILRGEWGFQGFVDTDMSMGNPYITFSQAIVAGTDSFLASADSYYTNDLKIALSNDLKLLEAARESVHCILYTILNSAAMNGVSGDSQVVTSLAWWRYATVVVDCILCAITVAVAGLMLYRENIQKGEKEC